MHISEMKVDFELCPLNTSNPRVILQHKDYRKSAFATARVALLIQIAIFWFRRR